MQSYCWREECVLEIVTALWCVFSDLTFDKNATVQYWFFGANIMDIQELKVAKQDLEHSKLFDLES